VITENVLTPCATGTCTNELVTTLYVNLDTDCDGDLTDETAPGLAPNYVSIADALASGGVCFYAEGKSPCPPWQIWNGQPQARITGIGGTPGAKTKTVSYFLDPPYTPVELSSFTARWYEDPSRPLILGAVVALVGGAVVGALVWRTRPAQR
jgi:hypothetical protein